MALDLILARQVELAARRGEHLAGLLLQAAHNGGAGHAPVTGDEDALARKLEGHRGLRLYRRRHVASSIAPDLARDLDDAGKLGALHLLAHADMLGRAGREAALRAERELLELDEAARLLDAALELLGALELRRFGGDQAQHHDLAGRQRPQ